LTEFIRDFKTTKMHSLAEIINFNIEHPELCLPPSMQPNIKLILHAANLT
jgi:hypothetical protein